MSSYAALINDQVRHDLDVLFRDMEQDDVEGILDAEIDEIFGREDA